VQLVLKPKRDGYIVEHCNQSMEIALSKERDPLCRRSCPELNDIDFIRLGILRCIDAVDSGRHFLQTTQQAHDELLPQGKVYAAGFIYSLNLRYGLLKPLCCVTNGTLRNQEIPALRSTIESNNGEKNSVEKCLYVYDKAVTDYHWWDKQASYGNYMILMLKENCLVRRICGSFPAQAMPQVHDIKRFQSHYRF